MLPSHAMSLVFADQAAKRALHDAIESVERQSSAEIVIALRRSSAPWHHVNALAFIATSFAALAVMLYSSRAFSLRAILIDPFIAGAVVAALVEIFGPLKRVLTPRAAKRRAVEQAAKATFLQHGVHGTTRRAGILVYASWLEGMATLVPDVRVVKTIDPVVWANAVARIERAGGQNGMALAAAIEALGADLALALPHTDGDVNELSDDLDEGAST